MFVPLAYRMVDDFSDEWWALVQSSPWFRDYWLQERFCDPQTDPSFIDIYDPALSDIDSLLANEGNNKIFQVRLSQLVPIWLAHWVIYIYICTFYGSAEEEEEEEETDSPKELVRLGAVKWRKARAPSEAPRYIEKAPKIVKMKLSPRTIQQPR